MLSSARTSQLAPVSEERSEGLTAPSIALLLAASVAVLKDLLFTRADALDGDRGPTIQEEISSASGRAEYFVP